MDRVFVRKALGLGTYFRAKKSTCYVVRERERKESWEGNGREGKVRERKESRYVTRPMLCLMLETAHARCN